MTLDVEKLTKSFDSKNVLDNISFCVKKDEVFGLLGPNGAGKTTMIRMILDILKSDHGEIKIFGKSFSEKIKERIEYKNKNVQELSKGMQRQLQFIISIIHNPDILILDEPFYGLDPINKKLFIGVVENGK